MGNITTSQHTHTIKADGKPIVNELSVIENKIAELRKTQEGLTRNTKEWTATAKEINQLSGEADKVRASMGTLGMTMGQLTKLQAELTKEFRQFGTGGEKLQEVNTRIQELRASVAGTHQTVQAGQSIWTDLGQWITRAFTIGALIEFGRQMISFGKSVFDVGAKFEKYEIVLTKAFQSQELARKSMGELQKLAANTPFTLDELTSSYVKLVNRGLTPSMAEMTKMGDLAASQGKSFDQLTEAILDAGTGEFERLKEFGISAKKNGNEVELSFKGIHKTVKMTPEAMKGAIESFGELKGVAGVMAATMASGEGKLSNLNDKLDAIKVEIYNGIGPALKVLFNVANLALDSFLSLAKTLIALPGFIRENKEMFAALGLALISFNAHNIAATASALGHVAAEKLRSLWTNASATAMVLLNTATKANPIGALIAVILVLAGAFITWYNKSETVRASMAGLWQMLKVMASAFADFVVAFATFDARKIVNTFSGLGDKLAKAYQSGYSKSMEESKKATAAAKAKEDAESKAAAKKLAEDEAKLAAAAKLAGQKDGHNKLSAAEEKHQKAEATKAAEAAKKSAEEYLKIRENLNDSVEKINEEFIDDDWKRKENAILREYQRTLAANKKTLEAFEGTIEDKKKLEEEFANYELLLYGKVEKDLLKLAKDRQEAENKIIEESKKTWKTALDKKGEEIIDLNKKLKKDGDDYVHDEAEKAKVIAENRRELFHNLLGYVNDSFNDTIKTLESIDSAYAQSQANRIKAVQAGFNSVVSGVQSLKIDTTNLFDGGEFGKNLGKSISNAFEANPLAFIGAAKKIIDGINGVFEANRWAKFEAPLRKIIDDSLAAIEDMGKTLEIKMAALQAEGDKLIQADNDNRDQLTAAALDFEAEQFSILVESKESLKAINDDYSAEELRIKALYADQLNSKDEETAAKAREIVAGLLHDLKVTRNDDIENLLTTERTKRELQASYLADVNDINKAADAELAELERTKATRTLEEQAALIAEVESRRAAALAKEAGERQDALVDLMDYKEKEAFINSTADAAILEVKKNANNLSIEEQQRLIDAINLQRNKDLFDLKTSELGIEFIKKGTAANIKDINESSAANQLSINSSLKEKQKIAEWQHNAEVYQAQLAAWQAEQKLTIGLLQLQLIKANGKIFNKSEAKAIEAALNEAKYAMPPMPPSGFFNYPGGSSSSSTPDNGAAASGGNPTGDGQKMENGGQVHFANGGYLAKGQGGLPSGPLHSEGGIWMWNPNTGQKVGELEGNEYIVNRRATAANLGLLTQINNSGLIGKMRNSSFNRTGQPVYEDGGVFSTFGPITLNQSNSMAAETVAVLNAIAKATGATANATMATADAAKETAQNSRSLGSIADATRATANKDFSPNISIIQQKLGQLANIEGSARL